MQKTRAAGIAGAAAAAVWIVWLAFRSGRSHRVAEQATRRLRHAERTAERRMRFLRGRFAGFQYRLRRRHPEESVADDILADRVRSSLGPLEKRLDTPRVHVTVCDQVVTLHGDVPTAIDAVRIEDAVRVMPGVRAVESHLRSGLSSGTERPSVGRLHQATMHWREKTEPAEAS